MNKHIKYDLENAAIQMKVGIMNALHAIDSGECLEISLGKYISGTLIEDCMEEAQWKTEDDYDYNGWECDFHFEYSTPSGLLVELSGTLFGHTGWTLTVLKND